MDGNFTYLGKKMPSEFEQVCKSNQFKNSIISRRDEPIRYFNLVSNFLKYD